MFLLSGTIVLFIIIGICGKLSLNRNNSAIKKLVGLLYLVALFSCLLDLFTKFLAEKFLYSKTIEILGNFLYLKLAYNDGAAFSLLKGRAWVFSVIAIVMIICIVNISKKVKSIYWALPLGIMLGGVVGNLCDRLFRPEYYGQGHVVDFIGYGDFFIGNLADIFIVLSIVFVVLLEIFDVPFASDEKMGNNHDNVDKNL